MRKLFTIWLLFCVSMLANAQTQRPLIIPEDSIGSLLEKYFPKVNKGLSTHMNLEFASSVAASFTEGDFDEAAFKTNRVRMEFLGSFNDKFSWHFRQSFNKYSNPHSLDNLSSSVEFAFVNWQVSPQFGLILGKQVYAMGGYESYVNAIKVREFCDFNNYISPYQAGISAIYRFSPTQELVFQVVNNRNGEDEDTYLFGRPEGIEKSKLPVISSLNWNGWFADQTLQLRYAVSYGQLAEGKNALYLTAGNIYENGPVLAYLDVLYARQGLDSHGIITGLQGSNIPMPVTAQNTEYFTLIGNVDYRVHPHWNVYVKGVYETARVYKSNGTFEKGLYKSSWNAQACVEYFPMKNSDLLIFAHLLYKGYNLTNRAQALGGISPDKQRFSIGLVYSIPVF